MKKELVLTEIQLSELMIDGSILNRMVKVVGELVEIREGRYSDTQQKHAAILRFSTGESYETAYWYEDFPSLPFYIFHRLSGEGLRP